MKSILRWLGLVLLVLFAVMVFRAWRLQPVSVVRPTVALPAIDFAAADAHLAAALRIPTLSASEAQSDLSQFLALHALLQESFPKVHAQLEREVVNGGALLYRWRGRDAACPALLLAAHQDVVPIEAGTEKEWRHAPFSGDIADGAIWGRGALDDKGSLFGLLEAAEALLAEGFVPACDVYFAFGHDEEIGGRQGAMQLAAVLKQRGVKLAWGLDEGGMITTGAVEGVDAPLATVGVAEKGFLSLKLSVDLEGGHSSMPPRQTAIGILAAAIARLESQPFPAAINPASRVMLRHLGAHMPFARRLVFANFWITAPLVQSILAARPATDATLRTTIAATMFNAGVKSNVLPAHAEAIVNFRIQPGDSVTAVQARVAQVIDDARVKLSAEHEFYSEPTALAPWDDPAFERIERSLRAVSDEPDLIVAPYITSGGTDLRHYEKLTPKLYRFVAAKLPASELGRIHGTNERIEIEEYHRAIRFYAALLRGDAK